MLIAYFDEVKHQPGVQPYEWLAGVAADANAVRRIEGRVADLATTWFGSSVLRKDTEFHACDIMAGKGNCKGRPLAERIQLLKDLADVIAVEDGLYRICSRIEVGKLFSKHDPADLAFMFYVEKVDELASRNKDIALLIGDFSHEREVSRATERLSTFRGTGTDFQFGRAIESVIDTVHFCRSHHSRMLQLADVYAWYLQLEHGPSANKEPQKSLLAEIRARPTDILWPSKFKHWPPETQS